jgi:hypothetical protein
LDEGSFEREAPVTLLRLADETGFAHHTFAADETSGPVEFVRSDRARPVKAPRSSDVGNLPQLLRSAGVTEIVLVHGTFVGNDLSGVLREVTRFSPRRGRQLRALQKRWLDDLAGEAGNYTAALASCLCGLVNPAGLRPIRVRRFHWSGENHHLGRAGGAMSFLDTIGFHSDSDQRRLLVLAHSHGGNVIAMLSQIIGSPITARRRFFQATRPHYESTRFRRHELVAWQRSQQRLCRHSAATVPPIDVATFGTPLRYRWNRSVCPNLLHFVQHRPLVPERPEFARLPYSIQDLLTAAGGDYVQQLGIAGSDFPPTLFCWRDWIVERRMQQMFEPGVRRRELIQRLKLGRRASCDGTTMLVDYADCESGWNRKLFGHGVYTCRPWLPFHLHEIARRFYTDDVARRTGALR